VCSLAGLAGEGLLFLTVAENGLDDPAIGAHLRDRAHGLAPVRPTALIVRRGDVVAQIAECVRAERSGLVVMGLRERARGRPGQVAAGVLRTAPAFVLAVPDVAVASNHHGRAGLRPGLRRSEDSHEKFRVAAKHLSINDWFSANTRQKVQSRRWHAK
jgi:hypothetical protein